MQIAVEGTRGQDPKRIIDDTRHRCTRWRETIRTFEKESENPQICVTPFVDGPLSTKQ